MKRVIGIVLAIFFGICFIGALFGIMFWAFYSSGYPMWVCALAPTATLFGALLLFGLIYLCIELIIG